MALDETLTETSIVNMAHAKLGSKRIDNVETGTDVETIQSRLHYEQTRDALLRSYEWPFATTRIELVADWVTSTAYTTDQYVWEDSVLYKCAVAHTSGTFADDLTAEKWVAYTTRPPHEWDYQYALPADYIRLKKSYLDSAVDLPKERHAIENGLFLTDDEGVQISYIKQVTDVSEFDALFVEILVLQLALKLLHPIAGTGSAALGLKEGLMRELGIVMSKADMISKKETDTGGRSSWNLARHSGINSQPERLW